MNTIIKILIFLFLFQFLVYSSKADLMSRFPTLEKQLKLTMDGMHDKNSGKKLLLDYYNIEDPEFEKGFATLIYK